MKHEILTQEFAIALVREALIQWEQLMNPYVKRIAIETWGDSWFENCCKYLGSDMKSKVDASQIWDAYRLSLVCSWHPDVFITADADSSRELQRFSLAMLFNCPFSLSFQRACFQEPAAPSQAPARQGEPFSRSSGCC
jgi:hypothetical protein